MISGLQHCGLLHISVHLKLGISSAEMKVYLVLSCIDTGVELRTLHLPSGTYAAELCSQP